MGFLRQRHWWRQVNGGFDHLDWQEHCALADRAECAVLVLLPPAKNHVGIDVVLASNHRH